MTFPAWDTFDADVRVQPRHLRVYRWCRAHLDLQQIRYGKREAIASSVTLDPSKVRTALNDLVAWGYLAEHPRDAHEARRFTLLWSKGAETSPSQQAAEGSAAA